MDAATIEETNRIRVSLGLKPLPVPGAVPVESQSKSVADDEDAPSTLESRQAQAYDNYKKIQDAEAAKKRREERAAAAKRDRDNAQRFAALEGKGLGEADADVDVDAKSWLKAQKKRQKAIEKARKLEEEQAAAEAAALAAVEYTSKDLAGVKVAHELDSLLDGDEQILTLKDSTIDQNEDEGDELENLDLKAREKLQKTLDLKKKKPAYDVHANENGGILSQYDEEIYGEKGKRFTLDGSGAIKELGDILGESAAKAKTLQNISLDVLEDAPTSDYLDISEIKVKKPKKRKSKSTRQKPVDEDDIFPVETAPVDDLMDVDGGAAPKKKRKVEDDNYVDDEDLQASLATQRKNALKKRKKARLEDIVKQLKGQADEPDNDDDNQAGGLVIDEISEFVTALKKSDEDEERKPKNAKAVEESVTAMDDESDGDGDHPMGDDTGEDPIDRNRATSAEVATTGVDDEKTIETGVGSALALLRERGILKDSHGAEFNMSDRQRAEFLAEKRRIEREQEERTRSQRERERNSGRLDTLSVRDREERARQANAHRELQQSRMVDDLFKKHYKPNVQLKYTDEHGRSLDQKEAFKHMSHQFHGKGSGKGKTDKRLKKIEDEKQREAQSFLDASENANMRFDDQDKSPSGIRLAAPR
ncbi:U4/U6.U5 tri-snRNP-associated protein snu66 [Colletotrichum orbiculare MAFF 240422]|uniref:U4/U6.U5 tri-snRNP-associated protein snu66 n=1 Tax=Colletotrichum orbiculare (strain 104-T / ATCC 96160 / CBS 514.97 / LARS 414 / MAFF 240422) TaxID=1213857 RepID=A0A484FZ04_COLOR|nr:U4/U6.U5 tri-snRNP-associated protein snu66 [Colletotrichum orbiculare MAFF 240422]